MRIPFISDGKAETFELIEGQAHTKDADPLSLRSVDINKRVPLNILEQFYRRDPDVYAAINHKVRTFMSSEYEIVVADKRVKAFFENFLRNCRFDQILDKVAIHSCVYGNAWVELVKGRNTKKTVTLDVLDPKIMDFGRTQEGHILYDQYNNPSYYVLMLLDGMVVNKNVPIVEHTTVEHRNIDSFMGNGIKFKTDTIGHFTYRTIGDQLDGIGVIEPIYNNLLAKIQIEKDWATAVKKLASPVYVGKSGNDVFRPNETSVTKLNDLLKDIDSKSVLTIPYYDTVEVLSTNIPSLEPNLSYHVDKIAASTGVPKPYIVGSGDQTPRSTFKGLNLGYERDTIEWQKRVSYDMETQVFKVICDEQGFDEIPKLVFEPPSIEYLDAKADRLVNYVNSGLLVADKKVRAIIRRMEGLPEEPRDVPDIIASIAEKKDTEETEDKKEIDKEEEDKDNGKQ